MDERRHTGDADADLPPRLLAVAEVVPDDDGASATVGGVVRAYDRRVSTEVREVGVCGFLMDAGPGT